MKPIPFIDLHEDIADNCLILSGKDFFAENAIHQGKNEIDLPVNNQVDLPRLNRAGARLVVAAACPMTAVNGKLKLVPNPEQETKKQIDFYHQIIQQTDEIQLMTNWDDYQKICKNGSIGMLLHIEGADGITPDKLEIFYHQGVRSIGLTHNDANELAGGARSMATLTDQGRELLAQARMLGMIVDLAHLNQKSFEEVIKATKPPFMFSHGGIMADRNHPRNLTDEQLVNIADRGGIVGVSFAPNLISGNSLEIVVTIFQYLKNLIGIEAIAIGSDFDGMISKDLVTDLEDVTKLGNLAVALENSGFIQEEIEQIFYQNVEKRLLSLLE